MAKTIFKIAAATLGATIIAFKRSPKPAARLIHRLFDKPLTITDQLAYEQAQQKVTVIQNTPYQTTYERNVFDLYYPTDTTNPVAVLFWVHGGGYVGGDKTDITEFATRIAADTNIAVVAMNYSFAPKSIYPGQLHQLDDIVHFFMKNKADYPMLNMANLYFGGDSAGAQIAFQYVTVQTNPDYHIGFSQTVLPKTIKGAISYCGPLDLKQMVDDQSDSFFLKFFVKTVAWSLIGKKDWQSSSQLSEASLVHHVTADFPTAFISDGNAFSFPKQGMAMVEKLEELGVEVDRLFFQESEKEIPHEYQFDYATDEAKRCYEQTVAFLNRN